jgi:hypothetical protein
LRLSLQVMCCLYFMQPTLYGQTTKANTKPSPLEVRTGVYLLNLYDLNMDDHSFYADFYVWHKWKGADFDPTAIELVNAVEKWGLTQTAYDNEQIDTLQDGTCYKIVRIESRFFHSFRLEDFPMDEHVLDVQIENPEYGSDQLVFVPDTGAFVGIRSNLVIDGWKMHNPQLVPQAHDYGTNFGHPEENARTFSKINFTVNLKRPASYFWLKMMLPLLVVMLVGIGALLLHPQYIDTRAQLPIGALLTAVFLQQSYTNALPDTGYMVLMDKIYMLAYIIISGVLLLVIMAGNAVVKANEDVLKKIDWREGWQSGVLVLLFALGVLLLML